MLYIISHEELFAKAERTADVDATGKNKVPQLCPDHP
jgi:hypothetical protein